MQLAPIIQQALLAETEELDLAHAQQLGGLLLPRPADVRDLGAGNAGIEATSPRPSARSKSPGCPLIRPPGDCAARPELGVIGACNHRQHALDVLVRQERHIHPHITGHLRDCSVSSRTSFSAT